MLGAITRGLGGVLDVAGNIFGRGPAVEVPQITNIQTTTETQSSGAEGQYRQPMMQANPLSFFSPQIATGIARNLPAIGRAIGIGGGVGLGANAMFGGDGEVCMPKNNSMMPYSVNKMSGCISVTRKQQARLKQMVGMIGLAETANAIGLDQDNLVLLLLKRFKARGRGITPASMRTTKRTIRQIKTLHNEVSSMAGRKAPVRRTSAVKQVKYTN